MPLRLKPKYIEERCFGGFNSTNI